MHHLVLINYGPYLCHGIINHRIQKCNGIFQALNLLGYEIELVPINEYNRLSIEMFNREIFRCDIRNLMFNMPLEDDPVCQRAVAAVEDAKIRMSSDENLPKYGTVTGGMRALKPNPTNKSLLQEMLPSTTELLYEIRKPSSMHRSLSAKHIKSEIGDVKISKVKIMEDKNTMFSAEPPISLVEENLQEKDQK